MPVPLYQAKAEFFRMPGHPARIRALEKPRRGPTPVRAPLAATAVDPAAPSRRPAVPRRSGTVTSTREGSTAVHAPAGGVVAEPMRAARRIPAEAPAGRGEPPAEPREAEVAAS
ncbi:transcriptional regulator [Streptomyces sp. NPDC014744]|uniref:transcriptional regulator n=1 Tax=Streptomyces sp. NPDC014744 TaxID=3364903 RepID=UPI003703602E